SPLLTLIMVFKLECTANELTPLGVPRYAAVSPLGLPFAVGTGALILLSKAQSLVLVTAMLESSPADSSFPRDGNARHVMPPSWWCNAPTSLFPRFSRTGRGVRPASSFCASRSRVLGGCAESE